MKRYAQFTLVAAFCLSVTVLCGCATVKELGKGFAGISTKVLEDKRKDALKESFALDYNSCLLKVKEILKERGREFYIYAEDPKKKMIALYLSPADTTPVGVFFTEEAKDKTLIEVSSPSIYAKEFTAKSIFTGISGLLKPKEEKKADAKEETGN